MESYRLERGADGKDEITIPHRGARLLTHSIFNRGTAFTHEERMALGLSGLLPNGVRTLEDQAQTAYANVTVSQEPLLRYVALADLEAANTTLYYRVLVDHLEELLPVVYTPTVGEACQKYSVIFRRPRGMWITPDHRGRIEKVLRNAPFDDVRLIVVTDNERILGLGDQGAGGMGIPVGKLALYVACAGLHPTNTLPISLDVGTDNEALLGDPRYLGWQGKRLRGEAYDSLVDELVESVRKVFPKALLQWEDFKKGNAFRLLDRYRKRLLSFNDDIQGTAAIALAGVCGAARIAGVPMEQQRIVMLGAGAAGIGIARLIRAELEHLGLSGDALVRAIAVLDSHGLLHDGRELDEAYKRELAWPARMVADAGLDPASPSGLAATIRAVSPTILIGTSGTPDAFDEASIREMASRVARPAIFPFSNPNSKCEARPADLIRWTDGRALIASGSPFDPVEHGGKIFPVAQGNNVYVFPGVGLGALAAEAREVTDGMFTAAAHAVADCLDDEDVAAGRLYPSIGKLRSISRTVARAVALRAVAEGVAPRSSELEARLDALIWEPRYPRIRL